MAAVPVGGAAVVGEPIAGRSRTEWVALAVRGPHGRMRRVFGPAPPRVTVRCAAGTVCVAALVPGPAPSGGGRLWLARATGGRTVYGALPLRVLRPVWLQFPAWAADGLYVRGPQGTVVRMWSRARATRAMRMFTWRMVPGTAMAFGVAATADSLRARWWGIVWPEAVFLVVMALVAEGALRTFERRMTAEQARVRRARDLFAALSDTNQLIVRHPDSEALFAATCRLLVERVGVWAARIGWVEPAGARLGVPDPGTPRIRWVAWVARDGDSEPGVHCRPVEGVLAGVVATGGAHFGPGSVRCEGLEFCQAPGRQAVFGIRRGERTAAVLWVCGDPAMLEDRDERALFEEMVLDLGFSLEDTARRQRLEHAASHDALTDLANRRCLAQALQAAHDAGTCGVLAMFYIEGLHEINATLGHSAGDEVLCAIARRLQAAVAERPGALATRGDGDRLYLLLPGMETEEGERCAGEVQEALRAPVSLRNSEVLRVEATAGGACWPKHWSGVAGLMARAELALEAARARGPGAQVGFEPHMEEVVRRAQRVRREFEPALDRGELTLYYQPVLSLDTGAVEGVEALVRWRVPDGTVRVPGAFLPQIEQDPRLLRELGCFVLGEALARIEAWSAAGLAVDVAVNIGASHLSDPAFAGDLDAALAGREAHGARLLIEITESAYLGAPEVAVAALEAARARGVRAVLDDFGTAYASLSYLQELPVDRVKIDRSFTSRLLQGRREEAIVGGVILTARLLGLDLVGEGVESDSQAELLRHLGCPKLQGYRIARPMPVEQAEAWLRAWDPAPWAQVEGSVMTPLLDRAEVLALALQDWVSARSLLRAARGEPADPGGCCPWLRGADTRSPFGRWLTGPGGARYNGDAAFQALAAEQAALERTARTLAGAIDGGMVAGREAAVEALSEGYERLL
ncbi:MAG TPA: phosphodiesterase, partial [Chromatiales bacterium]|nr:phosphodiesterase [Chromatiales bacterium]